MFDPLSTQFSAIQRETHRDVIGQQEYDRRTYGVLFGEGVEAAPKRRTGRAAIMMTAVIIVTVALYWLAQL